MILITTALMLEARPLVRGLRLHALGGEPFPVFSGENGIVVVTGTSALRASAATAWAFARFEGLDAALNIGFVGAAPRVSPLYKWHLIHSIRDASTGRQHVPDILCQHPFAEAALLTEGKVVDSDNGWDGLVDMEGSGFYEAARQFLSPDRIGLLKWVSDPLSGAVDPADLERRFAAAVPEALEFIAHWQPGAEPPSTAQLPLMAAVLERLNLTVTQQRFLEKWIAGYMARGGDPGAVLARLPQGPPAHKSDNRRVFEELKNVLKS